MRRELVRGEVIETMPPDPLHGRVTCEIALLLLEWARRSGGGCVGARSGHILSRNPDTVRGPDISYVRAEHMPSNASPEGFWNIAPDLAVEVVAYDEMANEARDKVRDFLTAGTPLVWAVYARTQEVIIHTPDGLARTYGVEDIIEYPDVLPGFSCKVSELFS